MSGGKKINILTFSTDTDALTQIKSGRAVADMNDFPVAAYNAKTSSGGNDFQVVGQQIGGRSVRHRLPQGRHPAAGRGAGRR